MCHNHSYLSLELTRSEMRSVGSAAVPAVPLVSQFRPIIIPPEEVSAGDRRHRISFELLRV